MDSSLCYKCHHTRSWAVLLLFSAIERDPGKNWGSFYRYVKVLDYKTLTKYSNHVSLSGFRNRRNFRSWNPKSRSYSFFQSGVLCFGIRNTATYWNAESNFHWKGIQNPVPEFRNPQRGIQNSRTSWITSVINAKKKPVGKDTLLCYESSYPSPDTKSQFLY